MNIQANNSDQVVLNEDMEKNKPLVSYVIATYNRKNTIMETLACLLDQKYEQKELIVVDNNSTDGTEDLIRANFTDNSQLRYLKLSSNKGVAGGRNEGIKIARGQIILIIDDDAVIDDVNATCKIVKKLNVCPDIGILGFRNVNFYTGKIANEEFPHSDKTLDPGKEFETSYFIGVAHAVRKEVFEKAGLYCESFFPYAFEELDLSFRVIAAGYKITYFPDVMILHKKTPQGRLSDNGKWLKMLENRIRTSIRNLPWRYVITSSFIWIGFVMIKTKGNIFVVTKAVRNIVRDMKTLIKQRHVISPKTITKIKKLRGRLLY